MSLLERVLDANGNNMLEQLMENMYEMHYITLEIPSMSIGKDYILPLLVIGDFSMICVNKNLKIDSEVATTKVVSLLEHKDNDNNRVKKYVVVNMHEYLQQVKEKNTKIDKAIIIFTISRNNVVEMIDYSIYPNGQYRILYYDPDRYYLIAILHDQSFIDFEITFQLSKQYSGDKVVMRNKFEYTLAYFYNRIIVAPTEAFNIYRNLDNSVQDGKIEYLVVRS